MPQHFKAVNPRFPSGIPVTLLHRVVADSCLPGWPLPYDLPLQLVGLSGRLPANQIRLSQQWESSA